MTCICDFGLGQDEHDQECDDLQEYLRQVRTPKGEAIPQTAREPQQKWIEASHCMGSGLAHIGVKIASGGMAQRFQKAEKINACTK